MLKEIKPSDWNKARIRSVVEKWKSRKLAVIGDVGVDRYTIGTVERISPEAPVPIVAVQEEKLKLGLAANVADNVRVLGGEAQLIGIVGSDGAAEDFRVLLKKTGLSDVHLVADSSRRTIVKERIVSDRQQLLRIDYETATPANDAVIQKVFEKFTNTLPQLDAVILQDYSKGLCSEGLIQKIINESQKSRKNVFVDPHTRSQIHSYRGAFLLTPNRKEAEALSGVVISSESSLQDAAEKIVKATQATHLIITLGKEGMFIRETQGKYFQIPTVAREVYDVSGAGDTVIAVLALALTSGAALEEAAIVGNIAAGIEVGKRGTATVSPEEIFEWLESH